ncbi:MAG: hypothetical protein SPJ13_05295 [Bacteroidales bacterium]|nr:hypothetical protein [Bacteroidales bacterium]
MTHKSSSLRMAHWVQRATKQFLDIVLHPLAIYTFLTIYSFPPMARWIGLVLGFVAPVTIGLVMQKTKKIKSYWSANSTHDRRLLILVNLIFYTSLLTFCNGIGIPPIIKVVPLITLVVLVATWVLIIFPWGDVNGHFVALTMLITYLTLLTFKIGLNLALPAIAAIVLMGIKSYLWMEESSMTVRSLLMSTLLGLTVTISCFLFL